MQAGGGGDDSVGTAWGWIRAHPFFRIPGDAVAALAADPKRLQMYCDWHRYTGVPLLQKADEAACCAKCCAVPSECVAWNLFANKSCELLSTEGGEHEVAGAVSGAPKYLHQRG